MAGAVVVYGRYACVPAAESCDNPSASSEMEEREMPLDESRRACTVGGHGGGDGRVRGQDSRHTLAPKAQTTERARENWGQGAYKVSEGAARGRRAWEMAQASARRSRRSSISFFVSSLSGLTSECMGGVSFSARTILY